jgi:hypothetical protein
MFAFALLIHFVHYLVSLMQLVEFQQMLLICGNQLAADQKLDIHGICSAMTIWSLSQRFEPSVGVVLTDYFRGDRAAN